MALPAFLRPRDAGPSPEHEELVALGVRLDRLTVVLEAHVAAHEQLPHAVWERLLVEIRGAAQAAALAAWVMLRRKVLEELSKWAWRAALGYAGIEALKYLHAAAGGLTMPGVSP